MDGADSQPPSVVSGRNLKDAQVNVVRRRATKAVEFYRKNVVEMNNNAAGDHQFKRPGAGYYLTGTQSQKGNTPESLRVGVTTASHDAYYKAKLREGFVDLRNRHNNEKNGKFTQPSPRGVGGYNSRQEPVPETPPKQNRSDYLYAYDSSNDGQSTGSNRSGEIARGGMGYGSNNQLDLDQAGDYIEDGHLVRHYGSSHSLDDMGPPPNDSFFDMLKEYKTDNIDQRAPAPPLIHDVLRGKVDGDAPQTTPHRPVQANGSVPSNISEARAERAASPRLRKKKKVPTATLR